MGSESTVGSGRCGLGEPGRPAGPSSSCTCGARRGSLGTHVWAARCAEDAAWERSGCARGGWLLAPIVPRTVSRPGEMRLTCPNGLEPLRSRVPASSSLSPVLPCQLRWPHGPRVGQPGRRQTPSSLPCAALAAAGAGAGDTEEGGGQPFRSCDSCGHRTDVGGR